MTLVGALGAGPSAEVDAFGQVLPVRARFALEVWVGAEDRWRRPTNEVGRRRSLVSSAPVVETAMHVPGGDVIQRVYGLATPRGWTAVEVENASGGPIVIAVTLAGRVRDLAFRQQSLSVGDLAVAFPGAARRGVVTTGRDLESRVLSGDAEALPDRAVDRRGRLSASLLFPIARTIRWRMALGPAPVPAGLDVRGLPDPDQSARGWRTVLDQGTVIELPDPQRQGAVDAALGQALLAADADAAAPSILRVLEDWGFRRGLPRTRRTMSRRERSDASVRAVTGVLDEARAMVMRESRDGVDLLPAFPAEWLGQPIAAKRLVTRHGDVSFALRWHGDRPALLWDAPAGLTLRATALDPEWSASGGAGEALLGAPPSRLLGLRPTDAPREGVSIDEPDSFT